VTRTANIASERVFALKRLGEPLGVLPRSVLVRRRGRSTVLGRPGGSDRVVSDGDQQQLICLPIPRGPLAAAGVEAARRSGVIGVALHQGGDADLAQLPLAFAVYLDDRRRHDVHPVRPCVTSATTPKLASMPGLVRLPHLLTVRDGTGALSDAVVWEVMTVMQAARWLGGPLPPQRLIENQLPALLQLRLLARTGRLPASDDGQRLAKLLIGRYLSIRLVCQHPVLFDALTRSAGTSPAARGRKHR
jgi:hypothetical protein